MDAGKEQSHSLSESQEGAGGVGKASAVLRHQGC
jgi:hypothetical protein